MDPNHSVTTWIGQLAIGDGDAAQQLWDRYFSRLVYIARDHLNGMPRQATDEEDVALSAFHAFCQAVGNQRVPQLKDRDDLWRTLVMMTAGKAIDQRRRHFSQKRGGGASGFPDDLANIEAIIGGEPDPALAVQVADELRTRLAQLGDDELRQIALLKLEGYTNIEIVERTGVSLRSVARRLLVIRRTWEEAENS